MVDLPTPPLAEDTAMTLLTSLMGRFSGSPRFMRAARFGGVPDRGRPRGFSWLARRANVVNRRFCIVMTLFGFFDGMSGSESELEGG